RRRGCLFLLPRQLQPGRIAADPQADRLNPRTVRHFGGGRVIEKTTANLDLPSAASQAACRAGADEAWQSRRPAIGGPTIERYFVSASRRQRGKILLCGQRTHSD